MATLELLAKVASPIPDSNQNLDEEGSFTCPHADCKRVFTSKRNLVDHFRGHHAGSRPHICTFPQCGKSFLRPAHLAIHYRIHTGEKPFVCEYPGCGKRWNQKSALKQHLRSHTGEKPFACHVCNKRFSTSSSCKRHSLTHDKSAKPLAANSQLSSGSSSGHNSDATPDSPMDTQMLDSIYPLHHSTSSSVHSPPAIVSNAYAPNPATLFHHHHHQQFFQTQNVGSNNSAFTSTGAGHVMVVPQQQQQQQLFQQQQHQNNTSSMMFVGNNANALNAPQQQQLPAFVVSAPFNDVSDHQSMSIQAAAQQSYNTRASKRKSSEISPATLDLPPMLESTYANKRRNVSPTASESSISLTVPSSPSSPHSSSSAVEVDVALAHHSSKMTMNFLLN